MRCDGGTIFDLRLNLEGERASPGDVGKGDDRALGGIAKTRPAFCWERATLRLKNLMDREGCLCSVSRGNSNYEKTNPSYSGCGHVGVEFLQ